MTGLHLGLNLLSLCDSAGLGCYWVDYSEFWKRKCTSLWRLLALVTLLFTISTVTTLFQEFRSFLSLSPNCIVYLCVQASHNTECWFLCSLRTAAPQWRLTSLATAHKPRGVLSASGSSAAGYFHHLGGCVGISPHTASSLTSYNGSRTGVLDWRPHAARAARLSKRVFEMDSRVVGPRLSGATQAGLQSC